MNRGFAQSRRSGMPVNPVVLILGATGLLGPYLVEAFSDMGRIFTLALSGADFNQDMLDKPALVKTIRQLRPDIVIHAAAVTDVEYCESDPGNATALHAGSLESTLSAMGPASRLVYISTDQVYPDTPGPHLEDNTGPVNAYGRSKLEGESVALRRRSSLVVRTNFFGPSRIPDRRSLSDFIINSLLSGKPVEFFSDVLFSPLHLKSLAECIALAVKLNVAGVYNFGSREGMSKKDFAHAVARHLGLCLDNARTVSVKSKRFNAPRPMDMRMNVGRLEMILGKNMPSLEEEIRLL